MKVLVTGATGFVGAAVVRALLAAGVEVRILARRESDFTNLSRFKPERAYGDLRDRDSLRRALSGCRQLYHVAAHYTLWAKDPSIFYDVNVTGTRNLLEAAREVGTERIVYTSTIGAIGLPRGGGIGTEDTPVSLDQMAGHYKRSKYLAEHQERDGHVIIDRAEVAELIQLTRLILEFVDEAFRAKYPGLAIPVSQSPTLGGGA